MTLTIQYTGQLANQLGTFREAIEVEPGMRLRAVIDWIVASHGPEVRQLFFDAQGGLSATLLVIFDGEQIDGDRASREVSGVRELMFMSPIAGG